MIYLDNAATTFPKPDTVIDESIKAMTEYGGNPGRGGHLLSRRASDKIFECRENFSRLIKSDNPEHIIFTKNATEALNLAIKGTVSKGDEIIISSMEHNSVLRSAVKTEEKGTIVKIAKADYRGFVASEKVEELITPKTRLICIIHASNVVGTVNPIEKICKVARDRGILTLVDCTQSAGILPINSKWFDMAAFAGHKGLYGPFGTGILFIREGIVLDTLIEGGTGSLSESALMPYTSPERYEAGTMNLSSIAGLNEGIKFVMKEGIYEKEEHLKKKLYENLMNIKGLKVLGNPGVGVLGITFSDYDCIEVSSLLDSEYGIMTRAGLHCAPMAHRTLGTINKGMLRISPGYFNTDEDISAVSYALNEILNK